jgi:hypothetical protein
MRGLYETIFGPCGQNQTDLMDARTQGLANSAFNSAYGQYAQQASMNSAQNQLAAQSTQQYNQAMLGQYHMYKKEPPTWVYNGRECSLKEFADLMYNDDEQGKLMFILKHGGV